MFCVCANEDSRSHSHPTPHTSHLTPHTTSRLRCDLQPDRSAANFMTGTIVQLITCSHQRKQQLVVCSFSLRSPPPAASVPPPLSSVTKFKDQFCTHRHTVHTYIHTYSTHTRSNIILVRVCFNSFYHISKTETTKHNRGQTFVVFCVLIVIALVWFAGAHPHACLSVSEG